MVKGVFLGRLDFSASVRIRIGDWCSFSYHVSLIMLARDSSLLDGRGKCDKQWFSRFWCF
jgi:hypothetical protein